MATSQYQKQYGKRLRRGLAMRRVADRSARSAANHLIAALLKASQAQQVLTEANDYYGQNNSTETALIAAMQAENLFDKLRIMVAGSAPGTPLAPLAFIANNEDGLALGLNALLDPEAGAPNGGFAPVLPPTGSTTSPVPPPAAQAMRVTKLETFKRGVTWYVRASVTSSFGPIEISAGGNAFRAVVPSGAQIEIMRPTVFDGEDDIITFQDASLNVRDYAVFYRLPNGMDSTPTG